MMCLRMRRSNIYHTGSICERSGLYGTQSVLSTLFCEYSILHVMPHDTINCLVDKLNVLADERHDVRLQNIVDIPLNYQIVFNNDQIVDTTDWTAPCHHYQACHIPSCRYRSNVHRDLKNANLVTQENIGSSLHWKHI